MDSLKGKFYLFCTFSLAGTSVISARFVAGKLGIFTIAAVSLFFAVTFLVPLCGKQLVRYIRLMSWHHLLYLLLQALCGIFLFRVFLLTGLRYTSAGEAGILTGASPAITAILAMVLLKEKLSSKKIAGILCTVAGVLIIQGVFMPGKGLLLEHIGGNMLVFCGAACESIFNTLSRVLAVRTSADLKETSSPIVQTTIVSGIALLFCLIPALFEQPLRKLSQISLMDWIALLWYGVIVTALAFICWYAGIKRCNAFTAAAFSGLMPFTAMLLSILVLGESVDYRQWLGGFFIIMGMLLIGFNELDTATVKIMSTKMVRKEQG